ncbi:TPA: hypothetical protein MNS24_003709 [Klebsiella pneumoniae]|uniref:hypothetical protein n=1 Tax=Klebsiella pneumoniae complex TaxID=3390273 RepID=UPI00073B06B5|nr:MULTISPECIES: hypothetical protein [Klebsiella]HDU3496992.1 hypothetical protein [Klebsiella pneumoniae subsp. pneumoniae]AOF08511.1 hypothetical protein A8C23_03405 [Klebsiella pneumoniae]EIX9418706.1 hypothetical protein [Klebsiella pneumoniae]KSZ34559.1 hypothetical protein APU21_03025 [Klebsiella pneumoniae]MBD7771018.1 hypothetical protein [Klebsiella pneumoniae]
MAGDVRIYYQIDDKEYSIEQWLNTDTLDTSDPEVLEAVMSVVPPGRAPSILRVIDIGSDGKPVEYDEYLIKDKLEMPFGLVFKKVGYEGWFYLADAENYGDRSGTRIAGNTIMLEANSRYAFPGKDNFPVKAVIDWDRRSLKAGEKEFYLEPCSP